MDVVEKDELYEIAGELHDWIVQRKPGDRDGAVAFIRQVLSRVRSDERERCAKWLEAYDEGREKQQNTGRYLARRLREGP